MTSRPDYRTSNYGWALWHLQQAESPATSSTEVGALHAQMAIARAILAHADQITHGATTPTTWEGDSDD